ncbi:TetR/AcrR family transcriptional regulator [Peteryoungia desertarenae]|uniref:TetR/AcrR family transcriptional regulator n=2 Tax=Peteryoungia desertarenae TaxID=1813451 RepID=A0ABX6QSF6_9HYPH|nr:TetR/AcrR family transcriptional regulator [Peteryoungia desertarenae]
MQTAKGAKTSEKNLPLIRRRPRRTAEETREEILNTAEALFRINGYVNTSIADIATKLGMSPANVFKHFRSKTTLIDAIGARTIKRLMAEASSLDKSIAAPDRLRNMVLQLKDCHIRQLSEHPFIFEVILVTIRDELECSALYNSMMVNIIKDIIEAGIAEGFYRTQDARKAAQTAYLALTSVMHPVMIVSEDADILATHCHDLVDFINDALR